MSFWSNRSLDVRRREKRGESWLKKKPSWELVVSSGVGVLSPSFWTVPNTQGNSLLACGRRCPLLTAVCRVCEDPVGPSEQLQTTSDIVHHLFFSHDAQDGAGARCHLQKDTWVFLNNPPPTIPEMIPVNPDWIMTHMLAHLGVTCILD